MDTSNSSNTKARRGQGKVDFLTLQDVIQKQINAGHTLITVYASSASELSIGYTQFTKYVSRYCKAPDHKQTTASQYQNSSTSSEHF